MPRRDLLTEEERNLIETFEERYVADWLGCMESDEEFVFDIGGSILEFIFLDDLRKLIENPAYTSDRIITTERS